MIFLSSLRIYRELLIDIYFSFEFPILVMTADVTYMLMPLLKVSSTVKYPDIILTMACNSCRSERKRAKEYSGNARLP